MVVLYGTAIVGHSPSTFAPDKITTNHDGQDNSGPIKIPFPYKPVSLQNPIKKAFRNSLLRKALRCRGDKIRTCDVLNPIQTR